MNSPQQREQEIRERIHQWRATNEPAYALGDYLKLEAAVFYLLARVQQLESALEAEAAVWGKYPIVANHDVAVLFQDLRVRAINTALTTMPEVANPLAAG